MAQQKTKMVTLQALMQIEGLEKEPIKAGELFEVAEEDAAVYKARGFAAPAPKALAVRGAEPATDDAEAAGTDKTEGGAPTPGGTPPKA